MPVRPKHSIGAGQPSAQRQFTDRQDFIAAFQHALAGHKPNAHQVLVYYGVGGIGKTSLRRELQRLIEAQPNMVAAALDFDLARYRDQETALFALRKELQQKYRVSFPTFDVAYAVYWQKSHPQTPMSKESFPFLEESVDLLEMISLAKDLPLVGIIARLGVLTVKGSALLKGWWEKRGHQELKDLSGMEPLDIASRLPMYWASDVKAALAGKSSVIFLDTYDSLTEAERVEGRLREREAWVRELVAQLPEILWVICGREELRWEEVDKEWAAALRQHLVGGLSDSDARQFLTACDIDDPAIRSVIVAGSQGVPYFLDLAVDTWVEIKERHNRIPKPDDFAHTRLETFDRFLRHLTHPEVETLKVLSVPRFWDYPLCEALVTKFQTGFSLTAFADLCRFSFISEGAAPNTWNMHQLMRQSLQEHTSPELVKRVHRFLFELYDGQLKDVDVKGITDRQKAALAEASYHGRTALAVPEFFEWFLKPAEQFRQAAQWRLLIPLYERVKHDLEAELGPDHPDVAKCLNNLAMVLRAQGKYAEAEPLFRRALAVWEKALGPEHPDVATSLNNLAELLRAQGKYAEAEPLHRRALAVREKVLGPEHPDVATSLNHLASLLQDQGMYAEAEPLFRRSLTIFEKASSPEHPNVAASLNNLAVLLGTLGRYAEAEPLHRRALAIREKALGPEHPAVAQDLNNLAVLLRAQGRHAGAELLSRRSLAILEKTLGSEHPDVATSLNNLATLLRDQGKYAEGETLNRRALAIFEKRSGPEHPDVAWSLNHLARLLQDEGKYVEAEPMYRRALAIRGKAPGPEHPDTAFPLLNLATLLSAQGRHVEAEPMYRRALAMMEKALGPRHPRVAEVLENLAALCRATGRDDEAKGLEQRVAEIRSGAK